MKQVNETDKVLELMNAPGANYGIKPDYKDEEIIILDNVRDLTDTKRIPIRLLMNCIAVCINGRIEAEIGGTHISVQRNDVFFSPPGVTANDVMISPDFECKALLITNRGVKSFLGNYIDVWNKALYVNRTKVWQLTENDAQFVDKFYDLLRITLDHIKTDDTIYSREVLHSIVRGGLLGICAQLSKVMGAEAPASAEASATGLFSRFLDLLQKSPNKHRPVASYASELCVTPKYLSVLCKQNSGKTAIEWITEYTLADITDQLRNTDLSIKEVSVKLGFPNSSFFGKYVRQHLGIPPQQYRDQFRHKPAQPK